MPVPEGPEISISSSTYAEDEQTTISSIVDDFSLLKSKWQQFQKDFQELQFIFERNMSNMRKLIEKNKTIKKNEPENYQCKSAILDPSEVIDHLKVEDIESLPMCTINCLIDQLYKQLLFEYCYGSVDHPHNADLNISDICEPSLEWDNNDADSLNHQGIIFSHYGYDTQGSPIYKSEDSTFASLTSKQSSLDMLFCLKNSGDQAKPDETPIANDHKQFFLLRQYWELKTVCEMNPTTEL